MYRLFFRTFVPNGIFALALSALSLGTAPSNSNASEVGAGVSSPQAVEGQIIVRAREGVSAREFADTIAFYDASLRERIDPIHARVLKVPAGVEQAIVQELAMDPAIEFAERDRIVSVETFSPDDPKYSDQWHLQTINSEQAWNYTRGNGITVAVLDTGVYAGHADLAGKLLSGWNAVDQGTDTSDIYGHGTEVAGVIAAVTNNGTGVASVAPDTMILPIRVSNNSNGTASYSDIARGLSYAADAGAQVANISYDVSNSLTVANAAQYMRSLGGVVVVAAGNSNSDPGYSDSPSMISVSATNASDVRASFSSYGNYVDVSAPGRGIWTTNDAGSYSSPSGTSFASPATAGVVALIMAANPSLTPAEVESLLESTSDDLGDPGWDSFYGHGRVNAGRAVEQAAASNNSGDTQAPSVAITSPSDNSTVNGSVTISVNASDNTSVSKVELYVGGSRLGTDVTSPYSFSLNTSSYSQGTSLSLTAYAYDGAGNSASAAVTLHVEDTTAPTVTAPANLTREATAALTPVNLGSATATDNVDGSLTASPDKTGPFAVGTHTVTWRATDSAGNTGSDSQTVVVRDTTAPAVTAPEDITVQSSGGSVSVQLGSGSASDLVDGSLTATPDTTGPFAVGSHTVTWSATDSAGNVGTATQTVVVTLNDVTAPVVIPPPDITVEASAKLTPVTLVSASASDDTDGSLAAIPDTTGPFSVGTHAVVWSATDSAGNRGTATQTVRVRDTTAPQLNSPSTMTVDATGYLTSVDLGTVNATDVVDGTFAAVPNRIGPFTSGRHTITWTATDAAGNSSQVTQTLKVRPQASFAVDQTVSEGGQVKVEAFLSGNAADYPVRLPYSVSGTALNPEDHDAVDGTLEISSGTQASLSFHVVNDGSVGEGDETVIFTLGQPERAVKGSKTTHTVTIQEKNLPPRASMQIRQNGRKATTVYTTEGTVTVTREVTDPNPGDSHRYDWSLTDSSLVATSGVNGTQFSFDPQSLSPGLYTLRLTVTDDGQPNESVTIQTALRVEFQEPVLDGSSDSDNDGTDDMSEGTGDTDEDGIPDYLDAIDDNNVLQSRERVTARDLLVAAPGLRLKLGNTALAAGRNGAGITHTDVKNHGGMNGNAGLAAADNRSYPGGLFDFSVSGLSGIGQSVEVVIPQLAPVPANGVYRKYIPDNGWQDFVIDARNAVASAPGGDGSCPAPGSADYRSGLHAGDRCIQLTIEDGGPNDTDGMANAQVVDPGGVATPAADSVTGGGSTGSSTGVSGGGGGGGCSLGTGRNVDPILFLLATLSAGGLARTRKRS